MVKSLELDKNDLIIMEELLKDSRVSLTSLAELTGLSIPAVKARVEKLVNLGVIKSFTILINPEVFSSRLSLVLALDVEPEYLTEVKKKLVDIENNREVLRVTGEYNVLLRTHIQDQTKIQQCIDDIIRIKGVRAYKSWIVTEIVKDEVPKIPETGLRIMIRCEYCGKAMTESYVTKNIGGVTRFFCCNTCAKSFMKVHNKL